MANNEISGPVVTTFLANWLMSTNRKYSYRIVFVPETIGSISYINKNLQALKENVFAGFVVTCVGDKSNFSFLESRKGDTYTDFVAKKILDKNGKKYKKYDFSKRGSDERQYCSPGLDLPVVSIMRSKYWEYDEYHTSLDLSLIHI